MRSFEQLEGGLSKGDLGEWLKRALESCLLFMRISKF